MAFVVAVSIHNPQCSRIGDLRFAELLPAALFAGPRTRSSNRSAASGGSEPSCGEPGSRLLCALVAPKRRARFVRATNVAGQLPQTRADPPDPAAPRCLSRLHSQSQFSFLSSLPFSRCSKILCLFPLSGAANLTTQRRFRLVPSQPARRSHLARPESSNSRPVGRPSRSLRRRNPLESHCHLRKRSLGAFCRIINTALHRDKKAHFISTLTLAASNWTRLQRSRSALKLADADRGGALSL